ncbi:MAG: glycosyltransferase [Gammaproteobacteria bacterium]
MTLNVKIKICALGALYNGDKPEYLRYCLESLRSQTLALPIILVVDGPISIQLEEVLVLFDDLDMRLIRNPDNQGLAAALQLALNCIGDEFEYVIRFDADDINAERRFEVTRDYLCRNHVDLVSCHMKEIDANGKVFSERAVPIGADHIRKRLPYRNPINHPAAAFKISSVLSVVVIRRCLFLKIGISGLVCQKLDLKLRILMTTLLIIEQPMTW